MRKFLAAACFGLVFASSPLLATTLYPQVNLLNMKVLQAQESHGDELYWSVTVYPSKGENEFFQVPQKPLHWLSEKIEKVTNLKLWGSELAEGEGATVILALIEHDAPPWNNDDLVGEVQLKILNEKGELKQEWSIPGRSQTVGVAVPAEKNQQGQKFELTGAGGHYTVQLEAVSATPVPASQTAQ